MLTGLSYFLCGWLVGLFLEYNLHIIMHRRSLRFHLNHHQEFFQLDPRTVALNDLSPRLNIIFFVAALIVVAPLMPWCGIRPVLLVWGGAFWHIMVVYEACHAIIHYDAILPRSIKNRRVYQWWRGCHVQHHRHSPTGNFCVSCPIVDWIGGTYVSPGELSRCGDQGRKYTSQSTSKARPA